MLGEVLTGISDLEALRIGILRQSGALAKNRELPENLQTSSTIKNYPKREFQVSRQKHIPLRLKIGESVPIGASDIFED